MCVRAGQLWWNAWEQWQSTPYHKMTAAHFASLHLTSPASTSTTSAVAPVSAPAPTSALDLLTPSAPASASASASTSASASDAALAAFFTSNSASASATSTTTTAAQAQPQPQPFYEGLFLHTLFRKLSAGNGLYAHSLQTNLWLTSVLSRVLSCPHPLVHSFVMDPLLPLAAGGATQPQPAAATTTTSTASAAASAADPFAALLSGASTAAPAPAPAPAPVRSVLHVLNDVYNRGLRKAQGEEWKHFPQRLEEARARMNSSKPVKSVLPLCPAPHPTVCFVLVCGLICGCM
jgi:hypothetical protein